ncbi:hypothetical protein AB0F18_05335 [Streptomyces sp. NPDC029216]|uniref:hypothetical protein n=1 Tax=Streptomyces sp. NPDC029216 TaxID=3154701 RepID=UPI003400BC3B
MKNILRRLAARFRSTPPIPPPPTGLPDEWGEDWWEPSWIWEPGDLDDEEVDR